MSHHQLMEDAVAAAKRAVEFDSNGQQEPAIYFYNVSAKFLEQAANLSDSDKAQSLRTKANEYRERAAALQNSVSCQQQLVKEDLHKQRRRRCHFLLQQALDTDAAGYKDAAVNFYANAIEFVTQNPELLQGELKEVILQALERAEELKGIRKDPGEVQSTSTSPTEPVKPDVRPSAPPESPIFVRRYPQLHRGTSAHLKVAGGSDTYTEEEKKVLFITSKINNNEFVPFMSIDLSEKFQYAIPFTDKDGTLALSPKQRSQLSRWSRSDEICQEPCILVGNQPDYYSIKQTVISDCSFVASLAVSALYEKRFGRRLVTAIIYPRNKDKRPVYNPFGKYMVKLHINGVSRKIIIDDFLPTNKYGQLLCSYSSNKGEFWVSLLEKAYMKVMGGYDFPGSNSSIDLHALTGWIPERVAIRQNDPDFNKDALFSTLQTRMLKGDVLVTVATGDLSEPQADRTGLVPTHAYAVLDVQTVNEVRLLKLKNPWSHLRWRGNYSELDRRHWTPELQKQLNYDPNSAAQFDNGVFWIDYDSICNFYDVFYMNWNPELFKYTYCIHQSWNAGKGPAKDMYTIGSNPQFDLDISTEVTAGAVWILLTRHITDIDDFRENKEYITILVYKGNGRRIYYPNDPPPHIDGVRINSPHYLCKIILNSESSRRYTLVVSQYEKTSTIYYTLRVYATCPFTLTKIEDRYTDQKQSAGEWKGILAGGCGNHPLTYRNNPRFRIDLEGDTENQVFVELKGPKQYQVGFEVTISSVNDPSVTAPFKTLSSGPYRSGFVVLELRNIPSGTLHIVPSTFLPNQEGPFILTVKATAPLSLTRER